MNATNEAVIDTTALASALRSMGLFYGLEQPLAATVAGSADEAEAVRAFIRRERPHLLTAYDLEMLVGMVLSARDAAHEAPASIESRFAA
jgi:hypothetical protein